MEVTMKIQKKMISSQVSSYLRDQIMRSELKPGERIVESQVARTLGVSQAPVREALRELEGMGFVEIRPYIGCRVLPIDQRRMREAYDIRLLLESYAATIAVNKLTDEQLKRMHELIDLMQADADSDDKQALIEHDVEFHAILMEASDNQLLIKVWRFANIHQRTALTIGYTEKNQYFVDSHRGMLEALEKKDVEFVRKELEQHFKTAVEISTENLSEAGVI